MSQSRVIKELLFTGHVLRQMFARQISAADIRRAVEHGELVADYPDDTPYPSQLLLDWTSQGPMHVVLGYDGENQTGYVITAYRPDAQLWEADFKTRKPS